MVWAAARERLRVAAKRKAGRRRANRQKGERKDFMGLLWRAQLY
jgi:hypothetical protein